MALLQQRLQETPAIANVKGEVLEEMRAEASGAVTQFFNVKTIPMLAQKLANSPHSFHEEAGRIAAQIGEQAYQKAKAQGVELPQSAIWAVPTPQRKEVGGAVFTAIDHLFSIGAKAQLVEEDGEDVGQAAFDAFKVAVKAATKAPGIGAGAQGLAEQLAQNDPAQQSNTAQSTAYQALAMAGKPPAPEEGAY